jgi:inner membrane protein
LDNLCHTLAGAALAEAGLKSRTRFGSPALMIAANLPDIDVLVFATGVPAVSFRRGWTHGVLAQALLPVFLAAVFLAWDRRRPRRDPATPPARAGTLLAIGYLGVLSHVLLDYLNNYGVRLLMPFSSRWFYGDTLFIVDVWLWLLLGAGVYWSRRRLSVTPARRALLAACIYILVMFLSARGSRLVVLERWQAEHGSPPAALMVGPLPLTPLSRVVIVDAGDHYETGRFSWLSPQTVTGGEYWPKRTDPAVRAARESPPIRTLLTWSRFPYFDVVEQNGADRVTFTDLRFGRLVGETTVIVPR